MLTVPSDLLWIRDGEVSTPRGVGAASPRCSIPGAVPWDAYPNTNKRRVTAGNEDEPTLPQALTELSCLPTPRQRCSLTPL